MEGKTSQTAIQKFFKNQSIFLTGGSGFIGTVLIYKLLTSCPDIRNIYVILRGKRGQDFSTRFQKILSDQLFDSLRGTCDNGLCPLKKVIPISGDISEPGLDLSNQDKSVLCSDVSIIFHAAATVRFDDDLTTALRTNFLGTKNIINLCKEMKNLKAMVYFSTAYSQFHENCVEERSYPPPLNDIHKIALIPDLLKNDNIETIQSLVRGQWPNTYVISKNLTEHYVSTFDDLPIAIIRPSVVVSGWREPIPGWTNSLNGPTKGNIASSLGILRVAYGFKDKVADIVPVDIVVNAAIAAAWEAGTVRTATFYNLISGAQNPITWGKCNDLCREFANKYPPSKAIWSYGVTLISYRSLYIILSFFLHYIPALVIDKMPFIPKSSISMLDIQTKVIKETVITEPFRIREWKFIDDNVRKLNDKLSPEDKSIFQFDIKRVNWREYSSSYMSGLRSHILKEDISSLPAARKRYKMFRAINRLLKMITITMLLIVGVIVVK